MRLLIMCCYFNPVLISYFEGSPLVVLFVLYMYMYLLLFIYLYYSTIVFFVNCSSSKKLAPYFYLILNCRLWGLLVLLRKSYNAEGSKVSVPTAYWRLRSEGIIGDKKVAVSIRIFCLYF